MRSDSYGIAENNIVPKPERRMDLCQRWLIITTISISLPETMKEFIESQVSQGGYGTASEYVRDLVRDAQKRIAQEKLEELLLEGLNSPVAEFDSKEFSAIKERLFEKYKR